jgi:hypothetical protein
MKRLAAGMLAFGLLGMQGGAQEPGSCRRVVTADEVIATQNRINTYFHRGVVPRLLACWNGLRHPGTVAVTFEFAKRGGFWIPGNTSLRSSSSADGEQARGCLAAAVAGTAFPVDVTDGETTAFNLNWSFPIPWPRDMNEVMARINTGGGPRAGECGGSEGPPPACQWCHFNSTWHFSYCGSACVGYIDCAVVDANTCTHTNVKCATGSVFGNIGGITMY